MSDATRRTPIWCAGPGRARPQPPRRLHLPVGAALSRTSGCGTRASPPSASPASTRRAPPTSCARCFRGQWANGMLPHMIFADGTARRREPPRLAVAARHADAPRDVATTLHHAAADRRDRGRAGRARRSPTTSATRSSPRCCPSSSPTTAGCSASACSTAPRSSRSSTRGSAGSTRPRRGCARCASGGCRGGCAPRERAPPRARSLRSPPLRHALPARRRARVRRRRPAHARARGPLEQHDFDLRRLPARPLGAHRGRRVQRDASPPPTTSLARARRRRRARPTIDAQHRAALEQLWHEPTQQYCSRDAVTHELLTEPTVADLPPAARRATPTRARARRPAADPTAYWPAYPVPSVPLDARRLPGDPLLEGPDLGEHQLGDRRGPRTRRRARRPRRRPAPPHPRARRRARLRRVLLAAHRRRPRRARVLLDRRAHDRPRVER